MEKQEKGGGRGGGVCSRSQRCGRGHTGEKCQEGGGQRREAAAGHHNIQTMVSPQHPCEVGWKVATIVMPTSQTRPGHRGKHIRGGLARQEGPVPSVGSPHIPAEAACNTQLLEHGGYKDGGLKKKKNKNKKKNKTQNSDAETGKKIDIFFPSGQILSERGSATGVVPSTVPTSCPHPGHPSSSEFHLCGRCPQHPTTSHQQWLPEKPLQ